SNDNPNAVNATAWVNRYYTHVSGMMAEYWIQNFQNHAVSRTDHLSWADYWNEWSAFQAHVQSLGLQFWPGDYISTSEQSQCRYLRASYLLNWSGNGQIMF